ncbi:hypothetical protein GCM10027614_24320 [Micromonospora vulcania]
MIARTCPTVTGKTPICRPKCRRHSGELYVPACESCPGHPRLGHACADEGAAATALSELEREIDAPGAGLDRLQLVPTPFVPEVRLHLAEDAIVWWARMEAAAGHALPPPYWASVWAGGQALARHLLDHPELAAGRRVLDLAAGSGLVAIAAALSGAARVVANDIDPYAVAAVTVNARANRVDVTVTGGDLLDTGDAEADLVVAGDVFYSRAMAARMLPFLQRAAANGAEVLVGDPGRGTCRGPVDGAGRLSGAHHRAVGRLVVTPGAGAATRLRPGVVSGATPRPIPGDPGGCDRMSRVVRRP